MEMTIGDAHARFAEALAAAERGERVVVTRDGTPVIEIGPAEAPAAPRKAGGVDWEKMDRIRKGMGWDEGSLDIPDHFDDPAYSRRVLGLED